MPTSQNVFHRPWVAVSLVCVILLSIAGVVFLLNRQKDVEANLSVTPAPPQPLGVGALGILEPGWKILRLAPSSTAEGGGQVETLAVEEGDEVHQGDVIAVLDSNRRKAAALSEARAQAQVATAKLAQVKAGPKSDDVAALTAAVEQQVDAVANAESEYQRALRLSASKATTDEEVDRRKSLFNRAQHLLEQTRSQLAALTTIRPEEVQVAAAELAKAEAGVSRAEAEWEDAHVRSPIDGRILKIFARPGERIGTDGLAEIGDTANMQAVAEVHERDAPLMKIGQPAVVKVQSLAGEITGEVVHVGWKVGRRVVLDNDPVKDTDARVVEVRIKLDSAANQRVAGLSYARVEVRIDIREGQ